MLWPEFSWRVRTVDGADGGVWTHVHAMPSQVVGSANGKIRQGRGLLDQQEPGSLHVGIEWQFPGAVRRKRGLRELVLGQISIDDVHMGLDIRG